MELCVFFHRFLDIDFVFQQNSQANLPTTLGMGKSAPDRCDCSELAWVSTATFQPTENRPTVWNPCLAPQGFEHSLHSPAFCKSWCLAKVEMFLKDIFLERVKIYIYTVYISKWFKMMELLNVDPKPWWTFVHHSCLHGIVKSRCGHMLAFCLSCHSCCKSLSSFKITMQNPSTVSSVGSHGQFSAAFLSADRTSPRNRSPGRIFGKVTTATYAKSSTTSCNLSFTALESPPFKGSPQVTTVLSPSKAAKAQEDPQICCTSSNSACTRELTSPPLDLCRKNPGTRTDKLMHAKLCKYINE